MDSGTLQLKCAQQLADRLKQVTGLTAFVGLDGFVDEIIHVVNKRENAEFYTRLPTIAQLAERLAGAAGKSTNIELVTQLTKLGGNGPIMANALASLGLGVTYLGNLGYPTLHPVFQSFARRAEIFSIAEPGHTDALEFDDGKVMFGKHVSLKEVNWENIVARFGRDKFAQKLGEASLVAFVNWTMIPYMSEIWQETLDELCPALRGPRRAIFFDLADPEKRPEADIARALELITRFEGYFDVILGLNEKEAFEIAEVLGISVSSHSPQALAELGQAIQARVQVQTVAIHPVMYALAVDRTGQIEIVQGPYVPKPLITTGAGDHFNAGFCLGKLLGLDNECSLLTAVSSSGYYVRTAQSPSVPDLIAFLRNWPERG